MATRLTLEPPDDVAAPTMSLRVVGHQLGCYGSPAHVVAYITKLQAHHHFPAPLPLYWRGRMYDGPHERSRWPRIAVEKWLLDRLPPDAAAHAERAELDAAAAVMDGNATRLFAVPDCGRDLPEVA